ncbi:DUF1045 domain-containing protein [Hoeflea alexandrii]|uniref:DUF1045 domain-containing protein n=1 Tax=Hoeflea alexandrii TaxID=288436 RepID=UPI002270E734|nr:DUF1045 domain-containing protein [Hoeflea alexandrii]MCY0153894.1 DUF1045 domain-containing protein [Hoeflea alexandrii]
MRYAIYFAPEAASSFEALAASWLGRDAAMGKSVEHPNLEGLGATELAEITGPARRYGFHATLKAPFRLAEGASETDLTDAMEVFAEQTSTFEIPALKVGSAGRLPGACAGWSGACAQCIRQFRRRSV